MAPSISIYVLVLVSFILFRAKHQKIARHYRSPFGPPFALFAIASMSTAIVTFFIFTPFVR
jgi:amino acid transporter